MSPSSCFSCCASSSPQHLVHHAPCVHRCSPPMVQPVNLSKTPMHLPAIRPPTDHRPPAHAAIHRASAPETSSACSRLPPLPAFCTPSGTEPDLTFPAMVQSALTARPRLLKLRPSTSSLEMPPDRMPSPRNEERALPPSCCHGRRRSRRASPRDDGRWALSPVRERPDTHRNGPTRPTAAAHAAEQALERRVRNSKPDLVVKQIFPDAGDPTADGGGKKSPQYASRNLGPPPPFRRSVIQMSPSDLWRQRLGGGSGPFQGLPAITRRCNDLGCEIGTQMDGPFHGFPAEARRCISLGCEIDELAVLPAPLCPETHFFDSIEPISSTIPTPFNSASAARLLDALGGQVAPAGKLPSCSPSAASSSSELTTLTSAQKREPDTGHRLDDDPTLELASCSCSPSSNCAASSSLPSESAYTTMLTSACRSPPSRAAARASTAGPPPSPSSRFPLVARVSRLLSGLGVFGDAAARRTASGECWNV
jgi:hypothetical protein